MYHISRGESMFIPRKSPRVKIHPFEDFRIQISKINDPKKESYDFYLLNISEEGASIEWDSNVNPLDIADSIEGILKNKNGYPLLKFKGYVVWKNNNKLGIQFQEEIIIPEQIIALEMSLQDRL